MAAMRSAAKKKKSKTATTAFHAKSDDGQNVVGIGNLLVVIVKDDDAWFAQGLHIDYAVQGSSLQNVKKKFERGLWATIHENLKQFGSIDRILRIAPQEIWDELVFSPGRQFKEYTSVSLHDLSAKLEEHSPQINLPFDAISFVESRPAA